MIDDSDSESKDMSFAGAAGKESTIMFVPLELSIEDSEQGRDFVEKIKKRKQQGQLEPLTDVELEDLVDESTIVIGTPEDMPDVSPRAATCADIFRKIGAELLIYTCSFGGIGVLTGVVMRFGHTPPLPSMLIGNGFAVLANETARVFFTSLIQPHGEEVPDDKKEMHEMVKKYGAHPISTVLTSTINGSSVALSGATDLGTRQIIVSITAQLGGLTTYAGQSILRKYFGGSIKVQPGKSGDCEFVGSEMKKMVSRDKNKGDENRPYLAGAIRNIATRSIGMFLATTSSWYAGVYQLENYCGPGGRQALFDMHGNFTVDDLNQHCVGGRFTMLFRDWGVTAVGLLGFLVVQPALNWGFNKIYDYFFPPQPDMPESDSIIIEELSDSDFESDSDGEGKDQKKS